MKNLTIDHLNKEYQDAEHVDQELFSEQRSNLLIISGEHYAKKQSKYWNRIRESKDVPSDQKIRLTKNHVQKITKTYVSNIVTFAPSVKPTPKNEKEPQDQKSAELNNYVWQDIRQRHKLAMKTIEWASDYINVGEVAVKVFWDPMAGIYLGEEPEYEIDESTGQPALDAELQPIQKDSKPKYTGDLVFERVYGFNLLRSKNSISMGDGYPWIIRKMVDTEELKEKVGRDPDLIKLVQDGTKKTYKIFDGTKAGYGETEGQTLLIEYYYPPGPKCPMGYYYFATEAGILWQGELPFGIWPIKYAGFDPIDTTPRHRGIVKQLRPNQIEINRAFSKMAEHQTTIGDDKLLVQSGGGVKNGRTLPGVRTYEYTGNVPTFLAGRSGDQYLNYAKENISEMYEIANLREEMEEQKNPTGAVDPFAMLYKSMKNKKKFGLYAAKFENLLSEICETALEYARKYYPDELLLPAIGRTEQVNVAEFRTTSRLQYSIKLEPVSDDAESIMGRQMVMNHAIQYIGPQLKPEQIGTILSNMPVGNFKGAFADFTMKKDIADNRLLALDRGEIPEPTEYDDHLYMIDNLAKRMSASDFKFMRPDVQENYKMIMQVHQTEQEKRVQKLQAAEAGFIPSGGARVKVDYYVTSPNNPENSERAELPAEAVDWLIKKLADQGSSQEAMQMINQGAVAQMAGHLDQQQGMQAQASAMNIPHFSGPARPQGAM